MNPELLLLCLGILTLVTGFANATAIAWCFGTSETTAIFFASSSLISILQRLLQAGQISEQALPRYLREKQSHNKKEAKKRFFALANIATLFAFVFIIPLSTFSSSLVDLLLPGFSDESKTTAASVFSILCPLIPAIVYNSFLQSLANAERAFGLVEWTSIASQLASTATILLTHTWLGIWSLVTALWINNLLPTALRCILLTRRGSAPNFSINSKLIPWSSVVPELSLTSLYTISTQVFLLTFNATCSALSAAQFSSIKYAELLFDRTLPLVTRPLSTVFFTDASENAAKLDANPNDELNKVSNKTIKYWSAYFIAIGCLANPVLHIAWGSKSFEARDFELMSLALTIFAAFSLLRLLSVLLRKLTFAYGGIQLQYLGYVVAQLFSAAVSILLVPRHGYLGAVFSVCVNIFFLFLSDIFTARLIGLKPLKAARPQLLLWHSFVGTTAITFNGLATNGLINSETKGTLLEYVLAILVGGLMSGTALFLLNWEQLRPLKNALMLNIKPTR